MDRPRPAPRLYLDATSPRLYPDPNSPTPACMPYPPSLLSPMPLALLPPSPPLSLVSPLRRRAATAGRRALPCPPLPARPLASLHRHFVSMVARWPWWCEGGWILWRAAKSRRMAAGSGGSWPDSVEGDAGARRAALGPGDAGARRLPRV